MDSAPTPPPPASTATLRSVPVSERGILAALGDPVSLRVLAALSRGERDVHTIVVETGLPQSSVYRKLHELADHGIAYVPRLAFTREGRKVEVFRARVREVRVLLADGAAKVSVTTRQDAADRLDELWQDVRRFGR
ncbi:MAG: helix-turn-helix domain-containing protein [Thermoplasmata archaeon]|nr:helix-turn-helix domain-containing protein [Thermoplasmata archaeon]